MRLKTIVPNHPFLIVILILFTALTLYQSITLPLGEADDETDHYQYLRFVARTGHPPFTETERQEAGFKGGLAPLYYWLTAWPIALVGEETKPDIRRVDARPERHIPTDGLGINHVLHTLDEQWPWRGQPLAWHLVRFLSLPMGWVTIIATYALVGRLLPEQKIMAVSATAFVAFLPRFVISSAVINDDNLVFALTALLLLIQVTILQHNRPATGNIMAAFGALFGLSLVTKYFSLILIPEVIFTLVVYQVLRARYQRSNIKDHTPRTTHHASRFMEHASRSTFQPLRFPLLIFFITLFLITGPWFIFIIFRFNRIEELGLIPGLAASLGEPQITEGLAGLLAGQSVRPVAATYTLPEWSNLLYRSFWFEYGWMRVFAPTWIYALFTVLTGLLLLGLIGKIWANRLNSQRTEAPRSDQNIHLLRAAYGKLGTASPTTWLLAIHLLLFIVVLLVRYILSATIDTGQGRHLYPALPVVALLTALGLSNLHRVLSQLSLQQRMHRFLSSIGYGLAATCFLLPATISLLPPFTNPGNSFSILHPSSFISPHYRTLPVSAIPVLLLPDQRQSIEFDSRLWLVGLEAADTVSSGDALPVTLYWHAEREARRDYLTSLCLQDDEARSVACWRGHFVDGQYPARAWETGDTIVDTVFIPIPTCYRLREKSYTLNLAIWPLDPASPVPTLPTKPLFQHTFAEPQITIQAADSLRDLPQIIDLWHANQRLTDSTEMSLGQSLAQITYAAHNDESSAVLQMTGGTKKDWLPLAQLDTPLYLPCNEGPTPFAQLSHFIVNPTLSSGTYQTTSETTLPDAIVSLRDRIFTPVTATLTFSNTLIPLSLHLANRAPIDLTQLPLEPTQSPITNLPSPISNPQLPIIIRWQAQRWMADPLVVSLKLLDKEFAVGGERVATLGNRYPNVLWAPTEIVEETYPLQLKPDAPPGLYQLEISLLHQDESLPDGFEYLPLTREDTILDQNLYPLTVRLLDPAHDTSPPQPLRAKIGNAIQLAGYEMNPEFSDSLPTVSLALYWQSSEKIVSDYTVFTQMISPDGQVWAQWDNPPQAGRYPTSAWVENDSVIDRYRLSFREGAPRGEYRLLVGMYDSITGQRLPVTIDGQPQPDNAIELTTLSLTP